MISVSIKKNSQCVILGQVYDVSRSFPLIAIIYDISLPLKCFFMEEKYIIYCQDSKDYLAIKDERFLCINNISSLNYL